MPLIIKGNKELKIVSKSEMKDMLNNVKLLVQKKHSNVYLLKLQNDGERH